MKSTRNVKKGSMFRSEWAVGQNGGAPVFKGGFSSASVTRGLRLETTTNDRTTAANNDNDLTGHFVVNIASYLRFSVDLYRHDQ